MVALVGSLLILCSSSCVPFSFLHANVILHLHLHYYLIYSSRSVEPSFLFTGIVNTCVPVVLPDCITIVVSKYKIGRNLNGFFLQK